MKKENQNKEIYEDMMKSGKSVVELLIEAKAKIKELESK